MARLLRERVKPKLSKSEKAGKAATNLRLKGSLGLKDAAAFLGTTVPTLTEYISKGWVDTYRVGRIYYIGELELWRVKQLMQVHGGLAKAMKAKQKELSDDDNGD